MTMYQPGPSTELQRAVANAIHEHWLLFLIEGIVLVLLGAAAIVVPVIATLTFTLVIGWLFLISGIVGLVTTFWMRNAPGFWWSLLSGVISIAAGIVLIRWPISGSVSLTLVLIAFFLIEGIVTLMYAFEHRTQLSGRWGWMLASGIVDLILAGIIFAGLLFTGPIFLPGSVLPASVDADVIYLNRLCIGGQVVPDAGACNLEVF